MVSPRCTEHTLYRVVKVRSQDVICRNDLQHTTEKHRVNAKIANENFENWDFLLEVAVVLVNQRKSKKSVNIIVKRKEKVICLN